MWWVRNVRGMENGVMLEGISETRRRGRPRTRWIDIIIIIIIRAFL